MRSKCKRRSGNKLSVFEYPDVVDPDMVGEYPTVVSSGAGYFYDEVLEYRVWCYVDEGAENLADGDDYYYPFETFEEADNFAKETKGAQLPFALIRQYEWINEYEPSKFRAESGERIAEWPAELLDGRERQENSIDNFFKERA